MLVTLPKNVDEKMFSWKMLTKNVGNTSKNVDNTSGNFDEKCW
jgi:hypothetical protein